MRVTVCFGVIFKFSGFSCFRSLTVGEPIIYLFEFKWKVNVDGIFLIFGKDWEEIWDLLVLSFGILAGFNG
jgi:hypothetical protein